jgi:hypothetical protein
VAARADAADRLRHQQVERARYEAELAQRRFLRVDPANRLVADVLEADWNAKLQALADAQAEADRHRQAEASRAHPADEAAMRALVAGFPRLWRDPRTPQRERKRMARLLVEDVTLLNEASAMEQPILAQRALVAIIVAVGPPGLDHLASAAGTAEAGRANDLAGRVWSRLCRHVLAAATADARLLSGVFARAVDAAVSELAAAHVAPPAAGAAGPGSARRFVRRRRPCCSHPCRPACFRPWLRRVNMRPRDSGRPTPWLPSPATWKATRRGPSLQP